MSYGLPSEGTRRLRFGLSWLATGFSILAIAVTLVLHGAPYWRGWWAAMPLAVVMTFFAGRGLTPILEWIIAGYRSAP